MVGSKLSPYVNDQAEDRDHAIAGNQNTGAYARGGAVKRAGGGCVTARGAATMAKLRARHGKDV